MPLVTVQSWIKSLLDELVLPGIVQEPLAAYIAPPDPNDEGPTPTAYIWPSGGHEFRQSIPRNTGPGTPAGWKNVAPDIEIYLTWFDSPDDPNIESAFPAVIDKVLQVLRTSPDPATITDPNSGLVCQLAGVGEHLTWQSLSVSATSDQRWQRFDVLIIVPFLEFIQA